MSELVELAPDRVKELDRKHVFHSWSAQGSLNPMVITKAEGSHVWDQDGQRLLDFTSQLVFTNLGHQHPRIVSAIQEQAAYLCTVADHGMNASTFAARVVASTGSDPTSAVVAAIGALKGPLHGGAPGPVLDMLDAVGSAEQADAWIDAELRAGRRIMGMDLWFG